jgi:hypothetical protein
MGNKTQHTIAHITQNNTMFKRNTAHKTTHTINTIHRIISTEMTCNLFGHKICWVSQYEHVSTIKLKQTNTLTSELECSTALVTKPSTELEPEQNTTDVPFSESVCLNLTLRLFPFLVSGFLSERFSTDFPIKMLHATYYSPQHSKPHYPMNA